MAYTVISKKSGKTYHLHERRQKLKGGQEVTLYYFAGSQRGRHRQAPRWLRSLGKYQDRASASEKEER